MPVVASAASFADHLEGTDVVERSKEMRAVRVSETRDRGEMHFVGKKCINYRSWTMSLQKRRVVESVVRIA